MEFSLVAIEHSMRKELLVQHAAAGGQTNPPLHDTTNNLRKENDSSGARHPVIHMFGYTPQGVRVCCHVHGYFPFLYVPYFDRTEVTPEAFRLSLERAVGDTASSAAGGGVGLGGGRRPQPVVRSVEVVEALPFYGFAVSKRPFLRIVLYNPGLLTTVANILGSSTRVLNRRWQPYEAHLPYKFQFILHHGLSGMGAVRVRRGVLRGVVVGDQSSVMPSAGLSRRNDAARVGPVDVHGDEFTRNEEGYHHDTRIEGPAVDYCRNYGVPVEFLPQTSADARPKESSAAIEIDVDVRDIICDNNDNASTTAAVGEGEEAIDGDHNGELTRQRGGSDDRVDGGENQQAPPVVMGRSQPKVGGGCIRILQHHVKRYLGGSVGMPRTEVDQLLNGVVEFMRAVFLDVPRSMVTPSGSSRKMGGKRDLLQQRCQRDPSAPADDDQRRKNIIRIRRSTVSELLFLASDVVPARRLLYSMEGGAEVTANRIRGMPGIGTSMVEMLRQAWMARLNRAQLGQQRGGHSNGMRLLLAESDPGFQSCVVDSTQDIASSRVHEDAGHNDGLGEEGDECFTLLCYLMDLDCETELAVQTQQDGCSTTEQLPHEFTRASVSQSTLVVGSATNAVQGTPITARLERDASTISSREGRPRPIIIASQAAMDHTWLPTPRRRRPPQGGAPVESSQRSTAFVPVCNSPGAIASPCIANTGVVEVIDDDTSPCTSSSSSSSLNLSPVLEPADMVVNNDSEESTVDAKGTPQQGESKLQEDVRHDSGTIHSVENPTALVGPPAATTVEAGSRAQPWRMGDTVVCYSADGSSELPWVGVLISDVYKKRREVRSAKKGNKLQGGGEDTDVAYDDMVQIQWYYAADDIAKSVPGSAAMLQHCDKRERFLSRVVNENYVDVIDRRVAVLSPSSLVSLNPSRQADSFLCRFAYERERRRGECTVRFKDVTTAEIVLEATFPTSSRGRSTANEPSLVVPGSSLPTLPSLPAFPGSSPRLTPSNSTSPVSEDDDEMSSCGGQSLEKEPVVDRQVTDDDGHSEALDSSLNTSSLRSSAFADHDGVADDGPQSIDSDATPPLEPSTDSCRSRSSRVPSSPGNSGTSTELLAEDVVGTPAVRTNISGDELNLRSGSRQELFGISTAQGGDASRIHSTGKRYREFSSELQYGELSGEPGPDDGLQHSVGSKVRSTQESLALFNDDVPLSQAHGHGEVDDELVGDTPMMTMAPLISGDAESHRSKLSSGAPPCVVESGSPCHDLDAAVVDITTQTDESVTAMTADRCDTRGSCGSVVVTANRAASATVAAEPGTPRLRAAAVPGHGFVLKPACGPAPSAASLLASVDILSWVRQFDPSTVRSEVESWVPGATGDQGQTRPRHGGDAFNAVLRNTTNRATSDRSHCSGPWLLRPVVDAPSRVDILSTTTTTGAAGCGVDRRRLDELQGQILALQRSAAASGGWGPTERLRVTQLYREVLPNATLRVLSNTFSLPGGLGATGINIMRGLRAQRRMFLVEEASSASSSRAAGAGGRRARVIISDHRATNNNSVPSAWERACSRGAAGSREQLLSYRDEERRAAGSIGAVALSGSDQHLLVSTGEVASPAPPPPARTTPIHPNPRPSAAPAQVSIPRGKDTTSDQAGAASSQQQTPRPAPKQSTNQQHCPNNSSTTQATSSGLPHLTVVSLDITAHSTLGKAPDPQRDAIHAVAVCLHNLAHDRQMDLSLFLMAPRGFDPKSRSMPAAPSPQRSRVASCGSKRRREEFNCPPAHLHAASGVNEATSLDPPDRSERKYMQGIGDGEEVEEEHLYELKDVVHVDVPHCSLVRQDYFWSEAKLLEAVLRSVQEQDPDAITAWDTTRSGITYLHQRSTVVLGVDINLSLRRLGRVGQQEFVAMDGGGAEGASAQQEGEHSNHASGDDDDDDNIHQQSLASGGTGDEHSFMNAFANVVSDMQQRPDAADPKLAAGKQKVLGKKTAEGDPYNDEQHLQLRPQVLPSIVLPGRFVFSMHRIMRSELKLRSYSLFSVTKELFDKKLPSYSHADLSFMSTPARSFNAVERALGIRELVSRTVLPLSIARHLDLFLRTAQLAQIYGITFFDVITRGSQFRVESLLQRFAKPRGYLLVSCSREQVMRQNKQEGVPLVMEPLSGYYRDPVIVLDFRSLYPSIMVAYNLCYSTALGKVTERERYQLGAIPGYKPPDGSIECLLVEITKEAEAYVSRGAGHDGDGVGNAEDGRRADHHDGNVDDDDDDAAALKLALEGVNIAPNSCAFVRRGTREGVLPQMLDLVLRTRFMVQAAMKKAKAVGDEVQRRIYDAQQTGLKLLANVTYGYASATFTGRMPCSDIADAIVLYARQTLETAMRDVEANKKWGARVVYGDTDSMFIHVPGATRARAFQVAEEIITAVNLTNPPPITLKLEKVYQPCFMIVKKRYVGYAWESPDSTTPVFDAKGIETIRRDQCKATATIQAELLRLLFDTNDITAIKRKFVSHVSRIQRGDALPTDLTLFKEVKLGTYSTNASCLPPAAQVAMEDLVTDQRAFPLYGERLPFVVAEPTVAEQLDARLTDLVVHPRQLLVARDSVPQLIRRGGGAGELLGGQQQRGDDAKQEMDRGTGDGPEMETTGRVHQSITGRRQQGTMTFHAHYYITKHLIPSLDRIFRLAGIDFQQLYAEMPRLRASSTMHFDGATRRALLGDVGALGELKRNNQAATIRRGQAAAGGRDGGAAHVKGPHVIRPRHIDDYYHSSTCIVCQVPAADVTQHRVTLPTLSSVPQKRSCPIVVALCRSCCDSPCEPTIVMRSRAHRLEEQRAAMLQSCRGCVGIAGADAHAPVAYRCTSYDCETPYRLQRLETLLMTATAAIQSLEALLSNQRLSA